MNNNDDKFLGRPVQFNAVGRIAEGTTDKVVRPVQTSSTQRARLAIGLVILIILAIVVFIASNGTFGTAHVNGGHQHALVKPTADPNF